MIRAATTNLPRRARLDAVRKLVATSCGIEPSDFPRQFSLRGLLLIVFVVAAVLSLVCPPYNSYRAQQQAAKLMEAKGGNVAWEYGDAVRIVLRNTSFTDADAEQLHVFTELESLCLDNTRCTDDSLTFFSSMDRLQYLSMNNLPISDAGLRHLSQLHRLRVVEVVGSQVTDVGVNQLRSRLPHVKVRK